MDHDRRACRDFMHLVLAELSLDEVVLFWHYLVYRDRCLLQCFDDATRPKVHGLLQSWACLMPSEQDDVMAHFVTVMTNVAKRAATLPRKEDG
jgi:hypothetical protein